MSKISTRLRGFVSDPSVSDHYGAWGALRPDQRRQIRELCDVCDMYEQAADRAFGSVEKVKAEAIKEFAERLKETDGNNNHTFDDCASILIPEEYKKGRHEKTREIWDTIDRIAEEMVCDNNVNTERKEDERK